MGPDRNGFVAGRATTVVVLFGALTVLSVSTGPTIATVDGPNSTLEAPPDSSATPVQGSEDGDTAGTSDGTGSDSDPSDPDEVGELSGSTPYVVLLALMALLLIVISVAGHRQFYR